MWIRRLVIAALLPIALLVAVWALHPWPLPLRWVDPSTSAYMEFRVREARAAGEPIEIRHRWVDLEEMPNPLVRAVLVAEDDRFREHRGVDWEALAEEVRYRGPIPPNLRDEEDRAALRAAWAFTRENRERIRGRSTLTQQLARNLYLSPRRSFIRKGQELLIARRLEFFLSKDRILELYLNLAEFGPGIFGVGAASEVYFDRSVTELTRSQAASLAATLPHPLTSNPATNPGRMAWRRDLILARLGGGTAPVPPAPEEVMAPPPPTPDPSPPDPIPPDPTAGEPDSITPDPIAPDSILPEPVLPDTITPDPVQRGNADSIIPDSLKRPLKKYRDHRWEPRTTASRRYPPQS